MEAAMMEATGHFIRCELKHGLYWNNGPDWDPSQKNYRYLGPK